MISLGEWVIISFLLLDEYGFGWEYAGGMLVVFVVALLYKIFGED